MSLEGGSEDWRGLHRAPRGDDDERDEYQLDDAAKARIRAICEQQLNTPQAKARRAAAEAAWAKCKEQQRAWLTRKPWEPEETQESRVPVAAKGSK